LQIGSGSFLSKRPISERLVVVLEERMFATRDVLLMGSISDVVEAMKARQRSALILNDEEDISF